MAAISSIPRDDNHDDHPISSVKAGPSPGSTPPARDDCDTSSCSHSGYTVEAQKAAASRKKEDSKGDSKFASHLKTSAGVSSFAKNRMLKEQREHLPAFACRDEVIRDSQGFLLFPCAA